jgi:hypothetical protein
VLDDDSNNDDGGVSLEGDFYYSIYELNFNLEHHSFTLNYVHLRKETSHVSLSTKRAKEVGAKKDAKQFPSSALNTQTFMNKRNTLHLLFLKDFSN